MTLSFAPAPQRIFLFIGAVMMWCLATAAPVGAQADLPEILAPSTSTQETTETAQTSADTTDTGEIPVSQWIANPRDIDYAAWEDAAARTEQLLLRNQARPFALERIRVEIAEWRDVFASAMRENDGRLATVESQLLALGAPPAEGETEATAISERRAALTAQRDLLAVPGLLASEAHARASGMIREIETQLRDRQTADLLTRNPSPLAPAQWGAAASAILAGTFEIGSELSTGVARVSETTNTAGRILLALGSIAVALLLFRRGRQIARDMFEGQGSGVQGVLSEFFHTIADAALPLIGLVALTYGLSQLDIFGPRGEDVLATVPVTGSVIILSGWLGRQFFPAGKRFGPLNLAADVRLPARRTAVLLAWLTALWLPLDAFIQSGPNVDTVLPVLNFPVIVVISVVLFRFATLLRHPPSEDAGPNVSQGRTRRIIGRLAQAVSIVAPVMAAFGYGAAAVEILFPTILTLGVIGVLVYLQSLAYSIHALVAAGSENNAYALAPVVFGFALLVISAPILALIWGAQRADLVEYWTRFTEGFAFGETQISPTDFLWFVLIFTFGYLLTQFIKNTLKVSVMPRTNLDLGAQNAIVAGFGYVGIFLAGVIAITSAGIDLSNLAIVAGALSVGIGFGLQNIVSNFVSGIILLIERPISEGDWIEVGGKMGYVRDISVRSTRIETFDQTDVIVPNADLVSNQVINWTRGNLVGRLILPVGVGYGSEVDQVMGILREVAEKHPMVIMNPPPSVLFLNFGADALEFEIRAILRDINFMMSVRSEMNIEIAQRFAAAGIEIPFAQRDIWLRNPEVLGHATDDDAAKLSPEPPQRRQADHDCDTDLDPDGDNT